MTGTKQFIRFIVCSALCLCLVAVLRHATIAAKGFTDSIISVTVYLIYGGVVCVWGINNARRITHRKIKLYLLIMAGMMYAWILIRTVKWTIINPSVELILWYCFYIPIITIPVISYLIARYAGKPDDYRVEPKTFLLLIPMLALIIMVMTNNHHGLVFRLANDSTEVGDYGYGPGYAAVLFWVVGLEMTTVLMINRRTRRTRREHKTVLSFWVGLLTLAYLIAYITVPFVAHYYELTAVLCTLNMMLWESLIDPGLIPSNKWYVPLMNKSGLALCLTDTEGNPYYTSEQDWDISEETFRELLAAGTLMREKDTLLRVFGIPGGHIIFQQDVAEINRLIEALDDIRDELKEEGFLAAQQAENESRRVKLEESQYLLEIITSYTGAAVSDIRERLNDLPEDEGEQRLAWWEILIKGTYVKRCTNLILLGEREVQISLGELSLSIKQSLENLKLHGVRGGISVPSRVIADGEYVLQCYDIFESVVEWNLRGLDSVYIAVSFKEGYVRMLLEARCNRGFKGYEVPETPTGVAGQVQVNRDGDHVSVVCIFPGKEVQEHE